MLPIDLGKIDKFLYVLIFTLVLLSILVIFAFKSVFSAYLTAYEIDQENVGSNLKINKEKLDEVHKWVFEKETTPLIF